MPLQKFIPLLPLLTCLGSLSAKSTEVVLDTIYDRYLEWNGHYLFIGEQQESTLLKDGSYEAFPVQIDRLRAGTLEAPLAQVGSRCYLLNDELGFDPDRYVELNLQAIYDDIYLQGNRIAYLKGNTVYVADFATHETTPILENATVSGLNERYLCLQQGPDRKHFIYRFDNETLVELPPAFEFPKSGHPDYVVQTISDDPIQVVDLDLQPIVRPEEGYTEYYIKGDLLLMYGRRKPVKVFHRNGLLPLEETIIDVECNYHSQLCFLSNEADQITVLAPDGQFLSESVFDNFYENSLQREHIILIKRDDRLLVYDADFELLLNGDYDEISYAANDRFLVQQNGRYLVVDSNDAVIIPSLPLIPTYMNVFTEYGSPLLFIYNGRESVLYDYDGTEIVRWGNQDGDQFANPGKYYRAINLRMVESLTDEQELQINPPGLWIRRERVGGRSLVFLCDRSGTRMSANFRQLVRLQEPGVFVVKTLTGKVGVLRIEK